MKESKMIWFLRFVKAVGYGLLFMILCQVLNGIVGMHTFVDAVLGILFVGIGECKWGQC